MYSTCGPYPIITGCAGIAFGAIGYCAESALPNIAAGIICGAYGAGTAYILGMCHANPRGVCIAVIMSG